MSIMGVLELLSVKEKNTEWEKIAVKVNDLFECQKEEMGVNLYSEITCNNVKALLDEKY